MSNVDFSKESSGAVQISLSAKNFKAIQSLLYKVSGISIADHKHQMVENRISKRIKELGIQSVSEYFKFIERDTEKTEIVQLINALTTNVTNFFRESHHFDHLRAQMLSILERDIPKVRIWSAGCSIGAEPYSMAITLLEAIKSAGKRADVKILATDIDTIALSRARSGVYNQRIVKGLTKAHLHNHFVKKHDGDDLSYGVKNAVRQLVSFNHLNFNDSLWPMNGPFDFIFCRNVLIYFKRDKQNEYIDKMIKLLSPGGFLYLGHSEHAIMENKGFKICGQTIYQKPFQAS